MTKNILSSSLLALLSMLAVACGDAGAGSFDEDLDPSEVLAGDQGGEDEAGANLEDEEDDGAGNDGGQDGAEPDGNGVGQEDDIEDEVPVFVEPGCGDGNLDRFEACDDGNDDSGDGCSSACEIEAQGVIEILLTLDSPSFNEPAAGDSCSGTIDLLVGVEAIHGSGRCFLEDNANTLEYVLDADLGDGGSVEGELEIILNGDSHVPRIEGLLEDGVLYFEFNSITRVTLTTLVIWSGEQKAVLD